MNLIEYKIENIKQYELDIWQGNYCSSLGQIRILENQVLFDANGLCSLRNKIINSERKSVTDGFRNCLMYFRKIVEGEIKLSDYLILETSLYLDPDYIFFNDKNSAVFLPKQGDLSFFQSLCKLAKECGCEALAEKLIKKNNEKIMSEKELLCFLSSWELELR